MKNKLSKFLIITLLILVNISPLFVFATTLLLPTPINQVFPDPNIAAAVANRLGKSVTDTIDQSEASQGNFYSLGASIVKTFEGLQYLTPLSYIVFYDFSGTDISPLENTNISNMMIIRAQNLSDISVLSTMPKLNKIEIDSAKISDVTPLKDMNYLLLLILNNNHIADLSSLKNLHGDYFSAIGQTINLSPTMISSTLTIPNPIVNADSSPVFINDEDISDGGVYDPVTNSITWTGLTDQNSVSYNFNSTSASGFRSFAFWGTVTQPLMHSNVSNKYGYTIKYFKGDFLTPIATEYGKTTFDEGYQLSESDVNVDFPRGWIDLHKPNGYESDSIQNYPVISSTDNIIKVLYTKISTPSTPQNPVNEETNNEDTNQVIITPEEKPQLPQTGGQIIEDNSLAPIFTDNGKNISDKSNQLAEFVDNTNYPIEWVNSNKPEGNKNYIVENYPVTSLPKDNIVEIQPTTNNAQNTTNEETPQIPVTPDEKPQLPQTGGPADPNILIGLCFLCLGVLISVRV